MKTLQQPKRKQAMVQTNLNVASTAVTTATKTAPTKAVRVSLKVTVKAKVVHTANQMTVNLTATSQMAINRMEINQTVIRVATLVNRLVTASQTMLSLQETNHQVNAVSLVHRPQTNLQTAPIENTTKPLIISAALSFLEHRF